MKQKIYILGLITTLLVLLGAFFKIQHWPGAGQLLILGIFILVFIFLPLALYNNYRNEGNSRNRLLYIVTWLTCFVVFTSMLFKIQHWAGAGIAITIALPFPFVVFLPVFLIVTGRNRNFNIYNTVYVLFLLVIISAFSALLALNVSKERIVDSLGIARNYTLAENATGALSAGDQSLLIQKIDDLIGFSEEYKNIYLRYYGITHEQWDDDPEEVLISGKWFKTTAKVQKEAWSAHMKLLSGLKDLISLLEKTPGYEILAEKAPLIFNISKTSGGSYNFKSDIIMYPMQPWLLTYLNGLETNLKMIRASKTAGI